MQKPGPVQTDAQLQAAYGSRAVWAIAVPMIISALSVPLLGIVDTAVLGHLDSPLYLAAVATGATVFSVLLTGHKIQRLGPTRNSAQAVGAEDNSAIRASLQQPLLIALVLAATMLVLQRPVIDLAAALLAPEPVVVTYLREYFLIRIWSAPAMLTNLVMAGWLLGMQNARAALVAFLVVNVSNMVLDVVFVLGFGMAVRGVAWATVIAEYLASIACILLVRQTLAKLGVTWRAVGVGSAHRYLRLLQVNGNLFLRSVALMFVFSFITARGARLGAEVLATNAVLLNFLYFFSYAQDGLANAAEALTGKAAGARNRAGLELTVGTALRWTAVFACGFATFYALAGPLVIDMLTGLPEIRAAARGYLAWLVALPLVAAWCFLYDGVYIGTTRTREMRIVMVSCTLLVFLPTWFALQTYGNHALWAALILFMVVRSVAMHLWYRRLLQNGQLLAPAAAG